MYMKKISLLVKAIQLFLYIAITSILLVEAIGFFVFDNRYNWDLRYLYYSQDPIVNDLSTSKPFWKYKPNSKIRFVATYQNLFSMNVEYDCTFNSNKYGFIDTGKVDDNVNFLVLGDSFTEGHGGCPWLTAEALLQDKHLSNSKILNGGLQGAGILQFEQVLEYFESELDIENIIIIAISNDFKRGDAFHWETNTECYTNGICGKDDSWHYIPIDSSKEAILSFSHTRSHDSDISFFDRLIRRSFTHRLYSEYQTIYKAFYNDQSFQKHDDMTPYMKNLEALERIKFKYPNLKIILVNQRDEVGLFSQKNRDTELIEKYLKTKKYNVGWCNLNASDYMPLDGHPNNQGYKKLFRCLSNTAKPKLN